MSKWADFGISAVSYNALHSHIERLRVHKDNGETISSETVESRQAVVSAINRGVSYVTILKNAAGNWTKGQPVFVININGTDYLKTVDNGKAADNLENLPEF